MEEIKLKRKWKSVRGYEGLYEVSNDGKVKSFVVTKKGRLLRQSDDSHGYKIVNLKGSTFLVHRLVASAFIKPDEDRKIVNHIDNNPGNNNVSNLEWCTNRENLLHAEKIGACDFNRKMVGKYSKSGKLICIYPSATDAAREFGEYKNHTLRNSKISQAAKGTRKTAYGFKWRYLSKFETDLGIVKPVYGWRIGQMVFNFLEHIRLTKRFDVSQSKRMADPFYWDDDTFNSMYDEYLKSLGLSPVVFKMAVENKTPEQVMNDTINSERYSKIKI